MLFRSRHNLNYWSFGDFIGIGAGAHGKLSSPSGQIVRTWKTRLPKDYLDPDKAFLAGERALTGEELGLPQSAAAVPDLPEVEPLAGIVPQPDRLLLLEGNFRLAERAHVSGPSPLLGPLLAHFNELTGLALAQDHDAEIRLVESGLGPEAYRLTITPEEIVIAAGGEAGWIARQEVHEEEDQHFLESGSLLRLLPANI